MTVDDVSVTSDREYSIVEEQLNVRVVSQYGETRYFPISHLPADEIVDLTVVAGPETE